MFNILNSEAQIRFLLLFFHSSPAEPKQTILNKIQTENKIFFLFNSHSLEPAVGCDLLF